MKKRIIVSYFLLLFSVELMGETENSFVCLSVVQSENPTYQCIFSVSIKFSDWCHAMGKKSDNPGRFSTSDKSCEDLGFIAKPQKMLYGDVYSCTKFGDKFTKKCNSKVTQYFNQVFR
jgi:hypothetical protein